MDTPNDVADWGEKDMRGAYAPGTTFTVNGQTVDPNNLVPISDIDREPIAGSDVDIVIWQEGGRYSVLHRDGRQRLWVRLNALVLEKVC